MKITNIFKTCFFGSIAAMSMQGCSFSYAPLVTFDTDGGTPVLSQRVKTNECVARPSIVPVKENLTFIDWYGDKEKTTVYDFSTPVTKDITIYAKFNGIEKLNVVAPNPPSGQSDFKVGDTVNMKDFSVYAVPTVGDPIKIKNFTSPSFDEDGNYTFDYNDVQKDGEIAYHEFIFNYKGFKGVCNIHATESGKTSFTIQYANLLSNDLHSHTTTYKNGSNYNFESSSDKLEVTTSQANDEGDVTVSYKIKEGAIVERNEKLYIKVIDENDKIIDYFLVQIFDNSDGNLAFGDIDGSTCYAYCKLSQGARRDWDPSGIGSLLIPTYNAEGKTVTQIGPNSTLLSEAFQYCTKITNIELPETITTLSKYSFMGCSSLTSIYLPKTLQTILNQAFDSCSSLSKVTFPDDIELNSIGDRAFMQCRSLKEFSVPKKVIKLGEECFYNCSNLEKLIVREDSMLTSVGKGAFLNVSDKLINVEEDSRYLIAYNENDVPNNHFALISINNDPYITSFTTHEDCYIVALEDANTYEYLETINITDKVTAIASYCFWNCKSIETVNFYDTSNLLGIGERAFSTSGDPITEMYFQNIIIPSTTIFIGEEAFYYPNGFNTHFSNADFKDKTSSWTTNDREGTKTIPANDLQNASNAARILKENKHEWYKNTSL